MRLMSPLVAIRPGRRRLRFQDLVLRAAYFNGYGRPGDLPHWMRLPHGFYSERSCAFGGITPEVTGSCPKFSFPPDPDEPAAPVRAGMPFRRES